MGRPAVLIELSEVERSDLEGLSRRRRTAQGLAQRAHIVLLAAAGLDNKAIAHRIGAVENTVGKWRRRFAEQRPHGRAACRERVCQCGKISVGGLTLKK